MELASTYLNTEISAVHSLTSCVSAVSHELVSSSSGRGRLSKVGTGVELLHFGQLSVWQYEQAEGI
jgi:hypothetical protein